MCVCVREREIERERERLSTRELGEKNWRVVFRLIGKRKSIETLHWSS